jgi:hypothetical protein
MPSGLPLPTIADLTQAFHSAVRARRDRRADGRDGSAYDYIAGTSAILWSREAQRDADLFRAIYFDEAEAEDLTERTRRLFGIDRVLDTPGRGFATLVRPTATRGAGTVWEGTRIRDAAAASTSIAYSAAQNTDVQASDLYTVVPIRATQTGGGVAVHASRGTAQLDDPLWDPSWTVASLSCDDGTDFELAHVFRARVRAQRLAQRAGYAPRIIRVCESVGADHVALFRSDYGGEDHGLNACYVGDAGYSGSLDLVRRVTVALEPVRVCGADMPVRPLTVATLSVRASVTLWDDPAHFHVAALEQTLRAALLSAFDGAREGFSYQRDALAGALTRVSDAVQSVRFDEPLSDASVLQSGQFPSTLTRYVLPPTSCRLTFQGPA